MTTFDDVRGPAIVCGIHKTLDYLLEGATPLELFALGEVLAHQAAQKAKREHGEQDLERTFRDADVWEQELVRRQQLGTSPPHAQPMPDTRVHSRQER